MVNQCYWDKESWKFKRIVWRVQICFYFSLHIEVSLWKTGRVTFMYRVLFLKFYVHDTSNDFTLNYTNIFQKYNEIFKGPDSTVYTGCLKISLNIPKVQGTLSVPVYIFKIYCIFTNSPNLKKIYIAEEKILYQK